MSYSRPASPGTVKWYGRSQPSTISVFSEYGPNQNSVLVGRSRRSFSVVGRLPVSSRFGPFWDLIPFRPIRNGNRPRRDGYCIHSHDSLDFASLRQPGRRVQEGQQKLSSRRRLFDPGWEASHRFRLKPNSFDLVMMLSLCRYSVECVSR